MEKQIPKGLGTKLKQARMKANLTQEEVADKAEVSVNYYARIERGEAMPRYNIVKQIAKVLKVDLPF
jgi:transcriptional regulator with XRE-family HTH domain